MHLLSWTLSFTLAAPFVPPRAIQPVASDPAGSQPTTEPSAPAQDDPWASYEQSPTDAAPAPVPQPAPIGSPGAQPAPSAPLAPPRRPNAGIGLLATGPVLVLGGIPVALAGNWAFRKGCVEPAMDPSDPANVAIEGFGCAFSAIGSFLLHSVAFLLFAGGVGMTAGGAAMKGKADAWDDAFQHGEGKETTGLKAGGGVLLGLSAALLVTSRVTLWRYLLRCEDMDCVERRQTLATGMVAISVVGIGAGASMLGYGLAYDRRLRKWAPHLALVPDVGAGRFGLTLAGSF